MPPRGAQPQVHTLWVVDHGVQQLPPSQPLALLLLLVPIHIQLLMQQHWLKWHLPLLTH